jgi:hypothetical protein
MSALPSYARDLRASFAKSRFLTRFAGLSRQRMMATNMLLRLATKLRLTIQSSTTTRTGKLVAARGCRSRGSFADDATIPMASPFGWN